MLFHKDGINHYIHVCDGALALVQQLRLSAQLRADNPMIREREVMDARSAGESTIINNIGDHTQRAFDEGRAKLRIFYREYLALNSHLDNIQRHIFEDQNLLKPIRQRIATLNDLERTTSEFCTNTTSAVRSVTSVMEHLERYSVNVYHQDVAAAMVDLSRKINAVKELLTDFSRFCADAASKIKPEIQSLQAELEYIKLGLAKENTFQNNIVSWLRD